MRKRFAVTVLIMALVLVGGGIVLALGAAREMRGGFRAMHVPARSVHTEERSFVVAGPLTLTLTGHRSAVTVSRGDDAHVVIRATIHAYPDATLDSLGVTIARSGDAITVSERTERGLVFFGPTAAIDYDVHVPAHTMMASVNTDGSIVVTNVSGVLALSSSNGPITVRGFDGSVMAQTTNGRVFLGDGRGAVNLTTQNAAIDVQNVQATAMTIHSTDGRVGFSGTLVSGARGQIDTTNGAVTLSLPAESRFTLDARTTNGSVNVAFPITITPGGDRQGRNTVQGTVGAPDGTLMVRSTNGSITIGKQG